ncbi:hypothetical protein ACFE04_001888 [Oxalis oulophora]
MNTNTRNLQANEPPTQNDSTMHGPLIVAMDEEIPRAHFFLRQRDEMIQDMTQQIRQMTEENYAMVHRLRNITTQNAKLAGKNEELKMNITRLRDAIGVRERDKFFMQEHRELAFQQIQILEDENRRMSEEAFLQMDTIELHNEERNALVQTSEWVKSQLDMVFPKVMKIRAKASMLARSCHSDTESPFEQNISSRLELIKIAKHKDSSSVRDPIITRTKTKRMSKNKEQEETSSARNLETESPINQASQDLLRQLLLAINGLNANLQQMKNGAPSLVIKNPTNVELLNSAFESQAHETLEETTHVPINQEPSVIVIPATQNFEPRTTMSNPRPRPQFHPQRGNQNWEANQNGFRSQPNVNQAMQGLRGRTTQTIYSPNNTFVSRPRKERISLSLPVNLIYDKLLADDKIHPIPTRSWDILPRWPSKV